MCCILDQFEVSVNIHYTHSKIKADTKRKIMFALRG